MSSSGIQLVITKVALNSSVGSQRLAKGLSDRPNNLKAWSVHPSDRSKICMLRFSLVSVGLMLRLGEAVRSSLARVHLI